MSKFQSGKDKILFYCVSQSKLILPHCRTNLTASKVHIWYFHSSIIFKIIPPPHISAHFYNLCCAHCSYRVFSIQCSYRPLSILTISKLISPQCHTNSQTSLYLLFTQGIINSNNILTHSSTLPHITTNLAVPIVHTGYY